MRLGPGELRRIRVEAEADLAAALLDERRQPIRKWLLAQPLTLDFSAEPAEKRGTLPPGIVIRSPVRGLTPWRGPRSATWNLPKPVKLTSPPLLSDEATPQQDAAVEQAQQVPQPSLN